MPREMQFDYGSTVTTTLSGVWLNGQLQLWDNVAGTWVDEAAATLANCLIAMTRLVAGDYYANAPAGIDLRQPYTIRYYDSAAPTLGTHIGVQNWRGIITLPPIRIPTSGDADFETIIRQIKTRILEITASQNPTYSVEGHSYSKGEYLEILGRQLEQIMKLRSQAEPFEVVSRGN